MDKNEGLPSLPDKSIDLCLTDPPYNIRFRNLGNTYLRKCIFYNDVFNNYKEWSQKWYKEIKRICNRVIFTCGLMNLRMWYLIDDFDILFWHNPTKQGGCRNAHFSKMEPILTFGKFKFKKNYFYGLNEGNQGFLVRGKSTERNMIHPAPKCLHIWRQLIEGSNPISVIDPFMGSGTTAQACMKLGIPWIGYEIMEEYKYDIDKRLKNCKKEPQQISLETLI